MNTGTRTRSRTYRGTVEGSLAGSSTGTGTSSGLRPHWHGLYAMTPLALLVLLLVLGVVVWIFTTLQITGTENAVYGLLQLTTSYPPGATAGQVAAYFQGHYTQNQTIANSIGWGVQVALWTITLSPDPSLVLVHLKHSDVAMQYLTRHASFLGKLRGGLLILLIGTDELSDFCYAIAGHTLVVMDGWHPAIPSAAAAGVLLVGLLYAAVLLFVNLFGVKYLFALAATLFHKLRGLGNR